MTEQVSFCFKLCKFIVLQTQLQQQENSQIYAKKKIMNTEELNLSQPSLKINPTTLRTTLAGENQQTHQSRYDQTKILKYFNDADQNVNDSSQKGEALRSEDSPNRLGIPLGWKRQNAVFKTFAQKNDNQGYPREHALSTDVDKMEHFKMDYENYEEKGHKQLKIQNHRVNRKEKDNALLAIKLSTQQAKSREENEPVWYNQYIKNTATDSECYFQANSKNYDKGTLKISKTKIVIGPIGMDLSKVMKIKIFPSEICKDSAHLNRQSMDISNYLSEKISSDAIKVEKENQIKLTLVNNQIFNFIQRYPVIVLPEPKESYSQSIIPCPESPSSALSSRLPQPFLSFARIILKKLRQLYPTIKSTEWSPPEFAIRPVIKTSSSSFGKYDTKNFAFIHGRIYKKSQVKGKWQKRYVIINQVGIYSYRDESDQRYSFQIQQRSIKYIWTWFTILKVDKQKDKGLSQIDGDQKQPELSKKITDELKKKDKVFSLSEHLNENQNPYLIIKIKHGLNAQTEFGIPVCGFDNEINKKKNWLFAFYKLMSQYEY